jgi:iron(III) transport system permease protein
VSGRGAGAALGVLLVLTVAIGTYLSHVLVDRANRNLESKR